MIARYKNNQGKTIDLMSPPYRMITADFFSYDWEPIENSSRIIGFERVQFRKEIEIDVFGQAERLADDVNALIETFDQDVFDGIKGTLYVNGHYIRCNVQELETEKWESGVYATVTFSVVTDEPFWIRDIERSFYADSGGLRTNGHNYPYNYPYNYTKGGNGVARWDTGALTDNPFELIFYGPAIDPQININGHPYEVYDTLERGDYVVITNYNGKRVTKHRNNGTTANLFDYRAKNDSVFMNVPPGPLTITWSGGFGFGLTIFERRSAPKMTRRGE